MAREIEAWGIPTITMANFTARMERILPPGGSTSASRAGPCSGSRGIAPNTAGFWRTRSRRPHPSSCPAARSSCRTAGRRPPSPSATARSPRVRDRRGSCICCPLPERGQGTPSPEDRVRVLPADPTGARATTRSGEHRSCCSPALGHYTRRVPSSCIPETPIRRHRRKGVHPSVPRLPAWQGARILTARHGAGSRSGAGAAMRSTRGGRAREA